jgi:hypothetical protein
MTWRKERSERLDELLHAHQSVGGPSRGRRWRTATLNEALLLRLAAEFQGFARDLHEQTCDTFAVWITPSDPMANAAQTRSAHGKTPAHIAIAQRCPQWDCARG